jgi:hypothetical protein
MDLSRLGIKLFATDADAVRAKDFVPIFHSWIQKQAVDNHQLIDVHDYTHIHNGPGVLLVAHEGNFSTDLADGKPGIAYFRKQAAGNTTEDAVRVSLRSALQAASLIEAEPSLDGRVRFRRDEMLVISNDRLAAPNDATTFASIKPSLAKIFGAAATFTPVSAGTRDRLTIRVTGGTLADGEALE